MWTGMVVCDINVFLNVSVQFVLRFVAVLIDQVVLQCIEVPFHRGVIVWIPDFAHALGDSHTFTVFDELLWYVLTSLIAVQNQYAFDFRLWFYRFTKGSNCQICSHIPICDACNNASIVKIQPRLCSCSIFLRFLKTSRWNRYTTLYWSHCCQNPAPGCWGIPYELSPYGIQGVYGGWQT